MDRIKEILNSDKKVIHSCKCVSVEDKMVFRCR